jgi:gamma-glutamylcyclotransferase (GGCT)/AIG2-like uncharacterized protein YtfP
MHRQYFAYGSNLNDADWRGWCARKGHSPHSIRAVGPAMLPDMELTFDYYSETRGGGALDLQPRIGQAVNGVLFEVSPDGWAALDAKEGAPTSFARHPVTAIRPDGTCCPALTYVVPPARRQPFVAPTPAYLDIVREGLAAHRLDPTMLDQAATGATPAPAMRGLFVYGTLMRGEALGHVLAGHGLTSVHAATVEGRLLNLGDYPGMVLDRRAGRVQGEFSVLADLCAALPHLDEIEEARPGGEPGGLYRRTLLPAKLNGGRIERAWTYVIDAPGAHPRIGSGNWRAR